MLARTFTALHNALTQRKLHGTRRHRKDLRTLGVETLEDRRLLALTDLAAISGAVFFDATDDGYNAGEGLANATVNLYQSDGDAVFEPSAGDTFVRSATTDADGVYRFDRLGAGNYIVEQPSQTAGGHQLDQAVSGNILITAADATGMRGMPIDTFDQTHQSVTAQSAGGNNPDHNAAPVQVGEAIGGERDLYALQTAGSGEISLEALAFGLPVLQFDSSSAVAGTRVVSWDGVDNDGLNLNETGLGGIDLTQQGNNAAIELVIGADQNNGFVIIRAYTDAGHWSEIHANIPNSQGMASETVTLEFDDFQAGTGASGPADFADLGAIQMEIVSILLSVDGRLEMIGTRGHTVTTQDFANTRIADLSLEKTVDDSTPDMFDNVTFTITVNNDGPDDVTGVEVGDALPPGLGFVSAQESQGAYNDGTGVWTVGDLNAGASATLLITASVDTPGEKTNIAQVSAADQYDRDSTPANNDPDEDDQDLAVVTPQVADLRLVKSVDNPTPNVGGNVTFTITVTNEGPHTATGVAVRDALPDGLTLIADQADQGGYNGLTDVWTIGTLTNGATATLYVTARVDTMGTKTNIAQVSAADQHDIDSVPNNNVSTEDDQDDAEVTPRVADLSLTKSVDKPIANVGEIVTFTLDLSNAGPDIAHNVTVVDVLPSGLTYVSSNGPYNAATGVWTVGTLGVGQTTSLQIRAEVVSLGTKTNVAEVATADEFDPDSTPNNHDPNEDDQDDAKVRPLQIDLSVIKDVDNSTPHVGENVTFTITVSNAGPDTATNVALGDTLPAGLAFVSDDAQGAYNSGSGTWTVGTLPVGGSASLQITAQVIAGGEHTNTAQVTAADQFDPDSTPANNNPVEDDQDDATITPRAAVAGIVYFDANNDGVKLGEDGIGGVSIQLSGTDRQGIPVNRSTTTGPDGSYRFDNLPPSNLAGYQIAETQPGDYLDGKDTVGSLGGQAAVPSNADRFLQVVVASGDNGTGYNFGEIKGGSISGHVYYDSNRDGVKQPGELGIFGAIVTLSGRDDQGKEVNETTTTDATGAYRFDNLRPSGAGGYHVSETQPGGYRDGQESPGTPSLTPQVLDDAFADLNLAAGVHATDFDFGEITNFVSKLMFMASGK